MERERDRARNPEEGTRGSETVELRTECRGRMNSWSLGCHSVVRDLWGCMKGVADAVERDEYLTLPSLKIACAASSCTSTLLPQADVDCCRYADIEVFFFKDLTHSTALLVVKALLEQLIIVQLMNKSCGTKFPSLYFSDWINERAKF